LVFILRHVKRLSFLIITILVIISACAAVFAAPPNPDPNLQPDVRLVIDGKLAAPAIRPIIVNKQPLLPLRYISEKFGAEVTWNAAKKDALVTFNGKRLLVDGVLVSGTLMVSADFFKRLFSMDTAFYDQYNLIVMSSTGPSGILSADEALKVIPTYNGYSKEDLEWLSKIVEAETKGGVFASRLAVANVIINRKNSPGFPNTIKGVIFDDSAGVQFTPTANGAINNTPTGLSVLAAIEALEGKNNASTALFFFNPKYATSNWISLNRPYAFTLGGHEFHY